MRRSSAEAGQRCGRVGRYENVVPASALRLALARIKEMNRALGNKGMDFDLLYATRVDVEARPRYYWGFQAMTGQAMAPIYRTLGISRACAYRASVGRPAHYVRAGDRVVAAQIRTVIRTRASYGVRRVRALVNREFETVYNVTRIQRVMELNGWKLPRATRIWTGRPHTGRIQQDVSNEHWSVTAARSHAGMGSSYRSASPWTATIARSQPRWGCPVIS